MDADTRQIEKTTCCAQIADDPRIRYPAEIAVQVVSRVATTRGGLRQRDPG